VKQKQQDDDRDRDPDQPKQNPFAHLSTSRLRTKTVRAGETGGRTDSLTDNNRPASPVPNRHPERIDKIRMNVSIGSISLRKRRRAS
jgi:hypothetical protein